MKSSKGVCVFSSEVFFVVEKLDALDIAAVFIRCLVELVGQDGGSTEKYTNVRSAIKTKKSNIAVKKTW